MSSVADHARARDFYVGKLGFDPDDESSGSPSTTWAAAGASTCRGLARLLDTLPDPAPLRSGGDPRRR
ncbi:hypothetical protein OG738_34295 [Amycolatopsis sp. NBC_01488]|uniref:hypothetical protein n=1 Tax=Amycolatopsis sp. NBC_01488 TaxID=2903563 RepID=UPI002E2A92C3|nr:hypothetical protein [Amycolatopsis sp. NBC_01488]